MLPIKKIIVPADFSEPSRDGLRQACELAEHFGAELLVVHVNAPVPIIPAGHGAVPFNVEGYRQEVEKVSKTRLEEFVAAEKPASVSATALIREGEVADEIVRAAEESNADLVVMATHGYSGWKKFILGSVTEKVVRIAPMPVLTISAPKSE